MTDTKVAPAAGIGRLGTAAAWCAALCCLPYLVLKLVWTLGMPVGLTDRSVLDSNSWMASNAVMAAVQLVGLLLVVSLTRPWSRTLPAWLVLFPAWVGTGLLFQVSVGAVLLGISTPAGTFNTGTTGIRPWVFVLVYASFAGQGAALAVVFTCHVRARWGQLLGAPTGEAVATHLATSAQVLAAATVVVALVFGYWAAGGTRGLSGSEPPPSFALQASRVAGAVVTMVGLLALAGRWGSRRALWLPAALVWLGSGALAAFDGLSLALNRLFVVVGAEASDPGWYLIDTALVVKVVIGGLAAVVGVATVMVARSPGGGGGRAADHLPGRSTLEAGTLPVDAGGEASGSGLRSRSEAVRRRNRGPRAGCRTGS